MTDFYAEAEALMAPDEFETASELPVPYLSPSSISTLLKCPEQFRQSYVLKKPRKAGPWGISGTAFHGARHFIMEQKAKGIEPTQEQIRAAWAKAFDEEAKNVRAEAGQLERMRQASWGMLQVYEQKIAPRIQGVVAVEQGARLYVPGVPMVIYGRIDLETHDEIVDTKTGRKSTKFPEPTWLIQGVIYSAMRQKAMTWHSIAFTDSGNVTFQTPWTTPTLRRVWRPRISAMATAYAQDAYEQLLHYTRTRGPDKPWPGSGAANGSCRYCDFKSGCPFYLN